MFYDKINNTMLRKMILTVALAAAMTLASAAYEWENIKPEAKLGGRMISAGYLRGKVVLLDRRDYGSMTQAAAIKQLQSIWATYKTKPFVLVGSHHGSSSKEQVEETLKKLGVTYPVYNDVRLVKPDATEQELEVMKAAWEKPEPSITIVDSTLRRKLYVGKDDRASQGVVGSALMAVSTPPGAKQYQFLLDYEIEKLPGRAFLRLKEFRERFPKEAAKYAADWERMSEDNEIKKLAKLVELSRLVKDRDRTTKTSQKITPEVLEKAIEKYSELKQSKNPNIAQEAKNALADIKWSEATLPKK